MGGRGIMLVFVEMVRRVWLGDVGMEGVVSEMEVRGDWIAGENTVFGATFSCGLF